MSFAHEDTQNASPDTDMTSITAQKLTAPVAKADSQSVTKRLQSELMQLMLSPTPGISAFPSADGNMLAWTATIVGPKDTPYADLSLKLSLEFPANYPYSPPVVMFRTPVYHPNIDFSGRICLDILKEKWSASLSVQAVLLSLSSLLGEPNK